MRHYEIVLLINPDQSDQVDAMMAKYHSIVTAQNGVVHRTEAWGPHSLAYPIKKDHKTYHMLHYWLLNLECNQQALDELRTAFRYNDAVIRSLVMRADQAETGESVFLVNQKESIRREKERESRMAFRRSFDAPADELAEIPDIAGDVIEIDIQQEAAE